MKDSRGNRVLESDPTLVPSSRAMFVKFQVDPLTEYVRVCRQSSRSERPKVSVVRNRIRSSFVPSTEGSHPFFRFLPFSLFLVQKEQ